MAHALVLRRRVQFYETDAAGIVHFSTFFRYMEEAEHALWRENGLSIFPAAPTHGWPRVAASFDYKRPLRFEDEFEVHLRVDQVTTRSLRYACRVECRGEVVAEGGMTIVCVERAADHTMRAVPIPEPIASLFRRARRMTPAAWTSARAALAARQAGRLRRWSTRVAGATRSTRASSPPRASTRRAMRERRRRRRCRSRPRRS